MALRGYHHFVHQNKERIDCINDVGLQIKKISNGGKVYIWYSCSTGSYLRINVDFYIK